MATERFDFCFQCGAPVKIVTAAAAIWFCILTAIKAANTSVRKRTYHTDVRALHSAMK